MDKRTELTRGQVDELTKAERTSRQEDGLTRRRVNMGTELTRGQADERIVNKRTSLPVYKLTSRCGRVDF